MRRPHLFVLPGLALAAGSMAAGACGGRIRAVPQDGGGGEDVVAPEEDASESSLPDASDEDVIVCDYDGNGDAPCTAPPPDDLLYPDPPDIVVAAGSYGVATFVATGPWTTDPSFFMWFDSTTLPILNQPQVLSYGTPESVPFLVPSSAAGTKGTVTVKGNAGNIERRASVNVTVTACQPWDAGLVCPGQNCGFQGDGCGGLLTCGQCPTDAPYCFYGQCAGTKPTPCPAGEGFDPDAGQCIPCSQSAACNPCPPLAEVNEVTGQCISADNLCICATTPKGPIHTTDKTADAGSD